MGFTFEKVADLKYDELTSLYLIDTDEILKKIFEEKIKTPFKILYKLINDSNETISTETKETIFEIFDKLISTREDLAERYQHLLDTNYANQVLAKKGIIETKSEPIENVMFKTESYNVKHNELVETPIKKEKTLPRRYGAIRVIKDIEKNGGKATPAQRASLNNNELKNLYVKIDKQLIKKMLSSDNNLSDEDCRKISKAIKTFKQQINTIIKK